MLAGYPPFYSDETTRKSQQTGQVLRRIRRGKYHMRAEEWGGVSKEGKSFVAGLLQTDPEKRMTVEQCLQHPWLSPTRTPSSADGAAASPAADHRAHIVAVNLKRHYLHQKFKRAVRVLIATTRWRRLLARNHRVVEPETNPERIKGTRGVKRKQVSSAPTRKSPASKRKR